MTYFRAVVMLIVLAAIALTFLPMLAITGLGDITASNGFVPSPTATTLATPASTGVSPASGSTVDISSHAISYDKTSYTVPAGPVVISYNNADKGIMHNVHLYEGKSDSGKSVGNTTLKPGPNTQTLNVTLQAGTYYFECDAHPDRMHGTITVT